MVFLIASNAAQRLAKDHQIDLDALSRRLAGRRNQSYIARSDVMHAVVDQMTHHNLRNELKSRRMKNSFVGSNKKVLRALLHRLINGEAVPQLLRVDALQESRQIKYQSFICRKHMLETLAGGIPDERWDEYEQNGWLKVSLNLTRRELKLLHLSHRLALCELGVTPTEPHTWENAKFHVSINGS
jgi:hypothetical protein